MSDRAQRSTGIRFAALAGLLSVVAAGCQSPGAERIGGTVNLEVEGDAVAVLQNVNTSAQACWIKSGDRAFRELRVIPELDTKVGKPRILVVRKASAQGLPQLVIEASGKPAKLVTYGPLAGRSISARMNDDIIRWAGGNPVCG